jgi:CheY-like chemotaxis protein
MTPRVLAVDDNYDNLIIVTTMLRGSVALRLAVDHETALTLIRQEAFDLILLDISLPTMTGDELLRQIRAGAGRSTEYPFGTPSTVPVIAMTAHTMIGDREKYLAVGFNDYVAKPILDMFDLFRAIERWVGPLLLDDTTDEAANSDELVRLGTYIEIKQKEKEGRDRERNKQ